MGRPSVYSKEIAASICAEMAEGRSLRSICQDPDMPSLRTVFYWLDDETKEDFLQQYARAMDFRAQAMFEDMIEASMKQLEAEEVTIRETEKGTNRDTKLIDNVRRSDLHVRTIQWALQRMAPKKYGEKLQLEGKIDNTHQWREDDESILDRLARQRLASKKVRKPQPQEDKNG